MSQIYKIHHLINNEIKKTYIFSNDNLNDNITNNIKNPIEHVKQNIYGDDRIDIVKHKILKVFNNQSSSEIYLFTKNNKFITYNNAFNNLT